MNPSPIQKVEDTAFMVAAFRARESARPDALFHDPLAARVVGEEGERLLAHLPMEMFFAGWSVVVRTRLIDDFIRQALAQGVDTVLNLGAGLDTRPYRMDLPASLRWIEVDYPELMALKEQRLSGEPPRCALKRVALDLSDHAAREALFKRVITQSQNVLVLTEGVTPYLRVEEVARLAQDLKRHPAFRYWVVDYFSPASYKYRQRSGMKKVMAKAPFLFEPEDYFGFFSAQGWRPKEIRYLPEAGERLGRPIPLPFAARLWIKLTWRFTPPERRKALLEFAGFVLFEQTV